MLIKFSILDRIVTYDLLYVDTVDRGCFVKKIFLENFCNSISFSFAVQPATLLKKRLRYRWSLVNFAKFLKTRFSKVSL